MEEYWIVTEVSEGVFKVFDNMAESRKEGFPLVKRLRREYCEGVSTKEAVAELLNRDPGLREKLEPCPHIES
jgi:hypothetical protein